MSLAVTLLGLICLPIIFSVSAGDKNDSKIDVDEHRMLSTITYLSSFTTRNTSTSEFQTAAEWVANQYRSIPGMKVELFEYTLPKGPRVPEDKQVVEVIATLPGADDERVIVGGHLDSINMKGDVFTGHAPGADDDLSGMTLALECAHIMSTQKWQHTLQFVAFSGEEQGLYGSRALATFAKDHDWKIKGVFSSDMVGSIQNRAGEKDSSQVRVFSSDEDETNSRELARYVAWLAETTKPQDSIFFDNKEDRVLQRHRDFDVKLVLRQDRFGRGGDHMSFNRGGYPAIRFVEVCEDYTRQHTPDDTVDQINTQYLRHITRLNILGLSGLANSPDAPIDVRIRRDQSRDTTLTWEGNADQDYIIYWRDSASTYWQGSTRVHGLKTTIMHINKDDNFFAVGVPGGTPVEAK